MTGTTTAYQFDPAGLFVCKTISHESPLEPGVFLLPARCTFAAPPADVPADKWPRWNGAGWVLVDKPQPPAPQAEPDPLTRLREFLAANPDVAVLLNTNQGQPANV